MLLFLLGLGVSDGFVNGEDRTGGFGGGLEGIDLDHCWLPDKGFITISDSIIDINSKINVLLSTLSMPMSKLIDDIQRV